MIDGKRLRDLRKKHGLTAGELAQIVGVARQQIVRYEAGDVGLNSDTLKKLAVALDVSADYLLGLSDSPTPYERKGALTWEIDTTRLLESFQPEFVARLLKSLGIRVKPETLEIDVRALLAELPAPHVTRFLKELDLRSKVARRIAERQRPDSWTFSGDTT